MQARKIAERLKFQDFNIFSNVLHVDMDAKARNIAILLHFNEGGKTQFRIKSKGVFHPNIRNSVVGNSRYIAALKSEMRPVFGSMTKKISEASFLA